MRGYLKMPIMLGLRARLVMIYIMVKGDGGEKTRKSHHQDGYDNDALTNKGKKLIVSTVIHIRRLTHGYQGDKTYVSLIIRLIHYHNGSNAFLFFNPHRWKHQL